MAYVITFLFIWFDAVIPIFPGETTLSAASTLAAAGELNLGMIMVAGAAGAIVGDSSLFWIARLSSAKMQPHLDKALEDDKVRVAWDALNRSPGLLIVAGRYVPGMRFVVNVSMGLSDIAYRRFFGWSVVSGILWSVYTCALAYYVATTLSGYPLGVAHHLLGHHGRRVGAGLLRRAQQEAQGRRGSGSDRRERGSGAPGRSRRIRCVRGDRDIGLGRAISTWKAPPWRCRSAQVAVGRDTILG